MATVVDVTLTGSLISDLTSDSSGTAGVYAPFYDDANPNTATSQTLYTGSAFHIPGYGAGYGTAPAGSSRPASCLH